MLMDHYRAAPNATVNRIAFRYVAGLAENHADINGLVRISGEKGLAPAFCHAPMIGDKP